MPIDFAVWIGNFLNQNQSHMEMVAKITNTKNLFLDQ